MLLLIGCAGRTTREKIGGADLRIRDIDIHGNEALSDKEILEYLHLTETRWLPPDFHYFYEGYVPIDKERIVELYAAHGYHDAAVVGFEVDRLGDREVVDLDIYVEEGLPTLVQSLEFEWPEGLPSGPVDRRILPPRVEKRCGLVVGKPFDVEEMENSEIALRTALQSRGYAKAEVTAHAQVDREAHRANVRYEIRPGSYFLIGNIEIEGLDSVPLRPVLVEVEPYEGKPYSLRRIREIEESVYAMDVFSTVSAELVESSREGYVDVQLRVSETEPQRVKLGFGLSFEPNRWEQWVGSRYSHANLFGNLWRLDLELEAGYAELPNLLRPEEHGPVARVRPRLRKKGLLEKRLVWTLEPYYELGIWEGYQFHAPGNRVGVSRFFTRFVEMGLSHNLRFVDFFNVDPAIDRSRTILGPDYRDPYWLSYIQYALWFRLTNSLLTPRNGVVLGGTYDLAGGIFGGQFDYHKVVPEARAYYTPLKDRLQFAARGQVGFIMPFGDEPGAPIDQKLYLGGTNTVRGWGLRRLAPYVQSCDLDGDCDRVPVGGNTSVLVNVETRVRAWRNLWAVAFFDMGDVQPEAVTFRPTQWNYSVGPGLRYRSRIGTFRLDLGIRLNNPELFEHQRRWALHFGLGESF